MISDMEDRIRDMEIVKPKLHRCGCHVINSSGKKIFLKSNVNYHGTHEPRCLLDQRVTDKANKEYIAKY